MSSDGAVRLGALRGKLTMLDVACRQCERRGRLSLERLIAEHGADASLPELRLVIAGDCPKSRSVSFYDRCGAHFPQLPAAVHAAEDIARRLKQRTAEAAGRPIARRP